MCNKIIFIFLIFLLNTTKVISVEFNCFEALTQRGLLGGSAGYGRNVDLSGYSRFDKILFLSDGIDDKFGFQGEVALNKGAYSLGARVSREYPEKVIVQTDFNITGNVTRGNLTQLHLDNSADNWSELNLFQFDLIVLRKGLCLCCRHKPCAGFDTKYSKSKTFFKNVIRNLNLNNPQSMAILHGQEKASEKTVARWLRIAEELEVEFPVSITFVRAPPGVGFKADNHAIDAIPEHLQTDAVAGVSEPIVGEFNSIIIRSSQNIELLNINL